MTCPPKLCPFDFHQAASKGCSLVAAAASAAPRSILVRAMCSAKAQLLSAVITSAARSMRRAARHGERSAVHGAIAELHCASCCG